MSTNKVIEEINLCDPIPSIRQSKKRKSSDETIFIDLTIDGLSDDMIVSSSKKSRLEENILISDEVTLSLSTLHEKETDPLISSSLSSGNGPRLTDKQIRIQKEQEEECVICYIPLAPVSTSENARLQFSVCTLSGASCSFCLACIKSFLSKTSGFRDSCPCCFNRIRSDTTLTILALPTNGREASLSTTDLPQMLLPSTSSSSSSSLSSSSFSSSLHPTTSMSSGGYSGISEYQANLILSSGITPAQLASMSESQRQSAATSVLKNEEEQKKRFAALEAFRSSLILGAGGPMMFAPRSTLVGTVPTFVGRPLPTSAALPTSSGPARVSSAVPCPCSNCKEILPQPSTQFPLAQASAQASAPRPSSSEPPPTLRIKLSTKKTGTRAAVSAAARAATEAISATTAAPSIATTTTLAAVASALTASLAASAATASALRASAPPAVAPPAAVVPPPLPKRRSKRKETE
jgi:hypothetical protein